MENFVAVVTSLTGDVWARSFDGSLRLLQVGDGLLPGETLVTATGAEVVLDFEGELVSVGPDQSLLMSASQRSAAPDVSDESVVVDPTLDAILAALDGDGDLLDELEAPAAGTDGAPDGGGASFVQLTRIVEAVDPLAFQFGTIGAESFEGLIFDGATVNDPGTLTTLVNNPNSGTIVVTGDTTNIPPGNTVVIVITDKNNNTVTTSAVVEENGSYTTEDVDVTDLTDGPITIDTSTTDNDGNPVTDQTTVELDIVESEITVETEVDNTGPSITVTGDTTDIPPGSELEVTITDQNGNTVTTTAIVEEDGSYTVDLDITDLTDGDLDIVVTGTDNNGNPVTGTGTDELDAVPSEITVETDVDNTGPSITVTGDTTDIPPGSELEVTITDQNGNTVTTTAIVEEDGSYTVDLDITDLTDGDLDIVVTGTDNNGNPVTGTGTDELDAVPSEITVETDVDNTGPSITVTGDTTDIPPGSELEVTITDQNGNTVTTTAIVEED
ncbi:hypothetical protein DN062_06405, partial [Nitrincola tibetensis]